MFWNREGEGFEHSRISFIVRYLRRDSTLTTVIGTAIALLCTKGEELSERRSSALDTQQRSRHSLSKAAAVDWIGGCRLRNWGALLAWGVGIGTKAPNSTAAIAQT